MGKMPKAVNFSFLNDSQYHGKTMPGPTKYSPNKEVVLKRVINLVNLDRKNDNYSIIS